MENKSIYGSWRDDRRGYMRRYTAVNREHIRELSRDWRVRNKDRDNELNVKERDRLKLDVFEHYAVDGKIKCGRCGFEDIRALTIDHIENNGADERRRLFGHRMCAGTTFYRWLRKNDYPKNGYQILCFNCNIIKKHEHFRCQK
jgi:hypothetical protein